MSRQRRPHCYRQRPASRASRIPRNGHPRAPGAECLSRVAAGTRLVLLPQLGHLCFCFFMVGKFEAWSSCALRIAWVGILTAGQTTNPAVKRPGRRPLAAIATPREGLPLADGEHGVAAAVTEIHAGLVADRARFAFRRSRSNVDHFVRCDHTITLLSDAPV